MKADMEAIATTVTSVATVLAGVFIGIWQAYKKAKKLTKKSVRKIKSGPWGKGESPTPEDYESLQQSLFDMRDVYKAQEEAWKIERTAHVNQLAQVMQEVVVLRNKVKELERRLIAINRNDKE